MIRINLKKKISQRVVNGHPWIFNNEVDIIDSEVKGGEIAEVYTHDKKFVGTGYVNPRSQIIVRLLSREKNVEINEQFFYDRLIQCWEYRKKLGYIRELQVGIRGSRFTSPAYYR